MGPAKPNLCPRRLGRQPVTGRRCRLRRLSPTTALRAAPSTRSSWRSLMRQPYRAATSTRHRCRFRDSHGRGCMSRPATRVRSSRASRVSRRSVGCCRSWEWNRSSFCFARTATAVTCRTTVSMLLDKPCYDLKALLRTRSGAEGDRCRDGATRLGSVGPRPRGRQRPVRDQLRLCRRRLSTADRFTLLRTLIADIAGRPRRDRQLHAQTAGGRTGSGAHVHLSVADADGDNRFLDSEDPRGLGLSRTAYSFIAGILEHGRALSALTMPTVNSYRRDKHLRRPLRRHMVAQRDRLRSNNRTTMLRVPGPGGSRTGASTAHAIRTWRSRGSSRLAWTALNAVLTPGHRRPAPPARWACRCSRARSLRRSTNLRSTRCCGTCSGEEALAEFIAVKRLEWASYMESVIRLGIRHLPAARVGGDHVLPAEMSELWAARGHRLLLRWGVSPAPGFKPTARELNAYVYFRRNVAGSARSSGGSTAPAAAPGSWPSATPHQRGRLDRAPGRCSRTGVTSAAERTMTSSRRSRASGSTARARSRSASTANSVQAYRRRHDRQRADRFTAQRTLSRSFKYHRPRGELCGCGQCANSLVDVDGRPGVRACSEPVSRGDARRAIRTRGRRCAST